MDAYIRGVWVISISAQGDGEPVLVKKLVEERTRGIDDQSQPRDAQFSSVKH